MEENLKNKRDMFKVELRKEQNESIFIKKRVKNRSLDQEIVRMEEGPTDFSYMTPDYFKKLVDQANLLILTDNLESLEEIIRKIRKELSILDTPPSVEAIKGGVGHLLKTVLSIKFSKCTTLQYEAAWAMSNVAVMDDDEEEYAKELFTEDYYEIFLRLIQHNSLASADQSLWAIGNACNFVFARSQFIRKGLVDRLKDFIKRTDLTGANFENWCWCVSTLCRSRPVIELLEIYELFLIFDELVKLKNMNAVCDILWGFFKVLDRSQEDDILECMRFTEIINTAVDVLNSPIVRPKFPALKVLGVFSSVLNDEPIEIFIRNPNLVPGIVSCISKGTFQLKRDALWLCTNILAGSNEQIHLFLRDKTVIQEILKELSSTNATIVREAITAIRNMFSQINDEATLEILGNFPHLLDLILNLFSEETSEKVLIPGLEIIETFFLVEQNTGRRFKETFEAKGGYTKLERLLTHEKQEVTKYTEKIIEDHIPDFYHNSKLMEEIESD